MTIPAAGRIQYGRRLHELRYPQGPAANDVQPHLQSGLRGSNSLHESRPLTKPIKCLPKRRLAGIESDGAVRQPRFRANDIDGELGSVGEIFEGLKNGGFFIDQAEPQRREKMGVFKAPADRGRQVLRPPADFGIAAQRGLLQNL